MVWVSAFCLVAQVLGTMHMALVQHTRCAEHGELVHAGEDAALPSLPAVSDDVDVVAERAADVDADAHEHCEVFFERERAVTVEPGSAALAWTPAAVVPLTPVVLPPLSRLYAGAPKTSPPSFA